MPRELPSPETLRKLLDYDPETGVLTWRERPVGVFSEARETKRWNTRYAGTAALTALDGAGYRSGHVLGQQVLAHRVIWALVHDVVPEEIDHINGNRTDNRLENLRQVTGAENRRNKALYSNNRSGHPGVTKYRDGWVVRVGRKYIGYFRSKSAAVAARKKAEKEHGFHKNHGRT